MSLKLKFNLLYKRNNNIMELIAYKGEKILVSDCDYEHLKQFKYNLNKNGLY